MVSIPQTLGWNESSIRFGESAGFIGLHLQTSWSFSSLFSGLWQPEKYTNDLPAEPWEWTTHTRAFYCFSEVVLSVFRDAMLSVYSNLHYLIVSRLIKKHWIQIILFWNVQYSTLNQENSRTMKVCNKKSMSLRVKARILLLLDLGIGNLNPVLWQPNTSQHYKIRLRINPKPYCDIMR